MENNKPLALKIYHLCTLVLTFMILFHQPSTARCEENEGYVIAKINAEIITNKDFEKRLNTLAVIKKVNFSKRKQTGRLVL